jgi:addiction module HigA family antidote
VLGPLGLSVAEAARRLGVSRVALSEIVNGRGISPEMAIRLAKAFGSKPEIWAGLQMQYDLA